jgi:hypothetical protein
MAPAIWRHTDSTPLISPIDQPQPGRRGRIFRSDIGPACDARLTPVGRAPQEPHSRVVQLCLGDELAAGQAGITRAFGTFDQRRQVHGPHAMHMGIAEIFCPKRALNGGNQMIVAIRVLIAIAALAAAGFWLRSALIKVPANIDTISMNYSASAVGTAWRRLHLALPHCLAWSTCFARRSCYCGKLRRRKMITAALRSTAQFATSRKTASRGVNFGTDCPGDDPP